MNVLTKEFPQGNSRNFANIDLLWKPINFRRGQVTAVIYVLAVRVQYNMKQSIVLLYTELSHCSTVTKCSSVKILVLLFLYLNKFQEIL